MHLKLSYLVVIIGLINFHPFHVSVMDAEHNSERKSVQVSHRLFLDDLEVALKDFYGLEYIDTIEPESPTQLDSLIGNYLQNKVFFTVNGKNKDFQFVGSELEGDARWCYYEIIEIGEIDEIEITNVALMDVFDDQQNIVHLKAKGKVQSYKLDKGDKVKTFKF